MWRECPSSAPTSGTFSTASSACVLLHSNTEDPQHLASDAGHESNLYGIPTAAGSKSHIEGEILEPQLLDAVSHRLGLQSASSNLLGGLWDLVTGVTNQVTILIHTYNPS